MNRLLEDYQLYVSELQARLTNQQTYFHKFSNENQVLQEIQSQHKQIQALIDEFKDRAKMNEQIEMARKQLIADHYEYPVVSVSEVQERRESNRWKQHLRINQQVTIKIAIQQVTPIIQSAHLNQQTINFECLKFHLHHIDKLSSSPFINYHPKYNLHSEGNVVEGKLLKQERSVLLKISHEIRPQNIQLYSELMQQVPIKIVAQASYGLVLGVANVILDDLEATEPIQDERCIKFKTYAYSEQGEQMYATGYAFMAKIKINIDFDVIAPQIKELNEKQAKKRVASKSRSPNKTISLTPSKSPSPKKKRQLITDLVNNPAELIELTVYEGQQYRYRLLQMNSKREITFRQLKNIKQRRIEMVKIDENYYLKCYLIRQNATQDSHIHFQFNQQTFVVHVVTDHLFSLITHQAYIKMKQKKKGLYNKLVCINHNHLLYPNQSNKIVKNYVKQTAVDGLLSSIFIKTVFADCQIYTHHPFVILDITHKEDGFMINYYYETDHPITQQVNTSLIFFLESKYKRINQIHVCQCIVAPRSVGRDTILKQLKVNSSQAFYQVDMRMIGNQNVEYQIRSTCLSLSVINSKNYRYKLQKNEHILLQILSPLPPTVDIIFTDTKSRCFFIRLNIIQESAH